MKRRRDGHAKKQQQPTARRGAIVLCLLMAGCSAPWQTRPSRRAEAPSAPAPAPEEPVRQQSEAEGLALVCASSTKVAQDPPDAFEMRPVTEWIAKNVTNPEALALVWGHMSWSVAHRAEALSARAKELEIADCPLAKQLALSAYIEPVMPEANEQAPPRTERPPPGPVPKLTQGQRELIERLLRSNDARAVARSFEDGTLPKGALFKSDLRTTIRAHEASFQRCYEVASARNPKLAGTLTVRYAVAPDGSVVAAQVVNNTTHSASLAACIEADARTWGFPQPDPAGVLFADAPISFPIQ